jgi:uncharacterized NAD-dependent epimerase/dehydratase family protein
MLGRPRRLALLAEGSLTALDAKTAVGILRYRPEEVAAVIDSTRAGRTAQSCVGVGGGIPVVADLAAAASVGADSLLIGIAPQGGELPQPWRAVVRDALGRGWDVLAGLHVFLGDDAEFRALAAAHGAQLIDTRRPSLSRPIAAARAARVEPLVVLTIGSDCNVGKMTTALEIRRALRDRGLRAAFVATGQTGIFIADQGAAIDAVPADFMAGTVEALVLEAARDADVVIVEGQGSLRHPAYSGVALALLHGAAPHALVLCHEAGRDRVRGTAQEIPPLERLRDEAEQAAAWVAPAKVIAASLNTSALDEPAARDACASAARTLGRPATDPVRFGCGEIADAIVAAISERRVPAAGERRAAAERVAGGMHAPHA